MKRKKLVVISHTEHYKTENGTVVGWGSTITELNYLADYWEEVIHVGCLYPDAAPQSALPYLKSNIRFVPIPPYGGPTFAAKVAILFKIPTIIRQVIKSQKGATEVQLRLPTSMGLFLLPLFSFFLPRNYTLWVKYAGNWNQVQPPISYRLQRGWLKKNSARCAVTINGFWADQPQHCYSFENPCLTVADIEKGNSVSANKHFKSAFTFAFVGRLENAKGVLRIIEALKSIPNDKIGEVHFVGDGSELENYKERTTFLETKVVFHGFLNKVQTHAVLVKTHFFLLPSDSEGFPKVIAEAACYGAIPVVSDVGSIAHYINTANGFVWEKKGFLSYNEVLLKAVNEESNQLLKQSKNVRAVAKMFTFENYWAKLDNLLSKNNRG
jgi:glycosyltransferase involved in cell wall biosynthesis